MDAIDARAPKPLDALLHYQGRTLRQLKRQGRIAIYELLGAGNVLYGYEVVIVKIHPTGMSV